MESSTLKDRLQDDKYRGMIAEMIDEFYSKVKDVKLRGLVHDEAILDMIETLMQYSLLEFKPEQGMVTAFILGVYIANRNSLIIPSELN